VEKKLRYLGEGPSDLTEPVCFVEVKFGVHPYARAKISD
jgi:hypothetical protein